jgi:hypothetical protein
MRWPCHEHNDRQWRSLAALIQACENADIDISLGICQVMTPNYLGVHQCRVCEQKQQTKGRKPLHGRDPKKLL